MKLEWSSVVGMAIVAAAGLGCLHFGEKGAALLLFGALAGVISPLVKLGRGNGNGNGQ